LIADKCLPTVNLVSFKLGQKVTLTCCFIGLNLWVWPLLPPNSETVLREVMPETVSFHWKATHLWRTCGAEAQIDKRLAV